MTYRETYKLIIKCCSKGHKDLHEIARYVNKGKRGKERQSEAALSARRRDPLIKDLIITEYFSGTKGYYIALPGAMAELRRRLYE